MSFDEYFGFDDRMDLFDQVVAFLVGLTPRATQGPYMDFSQLDLSTGRGPSAALACHLCSGVAAAETLKILLGRTPIHPAPCYFQFDAYRQILARGRLLWGSRNPWQRRKRKKVKALLIGMGLGGLADSGPR
jgi:hypothetical protein